MQLKRKVLEFWLTDISIILPDVVEVEDGASPSGMASNHTYVCLTNDLLHRRVKARYRGNN